MKSPFPLVLFALVVLTPGCVFADFNMKLFADETAPLREFTLSGDGEDKIVLIPLTGVISTEPESGLTGSGPSQVQEFVSHLDKASADPDVKAVVVQIDSPGGSVTASDILYHELTRYKKRTQAKVVAAMMDVAASGGYYLAAGADRIVAHPTTVTGSIGVIFMNANATGLMEKIGVSAVVIKSGLHKDMGSPFKPRSAQDDALFQAMIDEFYGRFVKVVATGRGLDEERVREIADGRVYTGCQALANGLVDRLGYLDDAVAEARGAAGLGDDARVVVYRRTLYSNDNAYNTATIQAGQAALKIFDIGLEKFIAPPRTGFYYLWLPN
jgi:protease IV